MRAGDEASREGWSQGPQFDLFLDSVQDYAIFMLDPAGHVVTWNKGAERLKGYTEKEILGKHFSIFYTEEDRRRHHPEAELEIARGQGRYEEEGWRRRKDSTVFWANVVITAIRDSAGRLVGFGKVTRNLTERRKMQGEQAARAEAEAANRAKSDLLAVMSHELRNPLHVMLSYLDLLLNGVPEPIPDASKRQVERVRTAGQQLLQLIEQSLTYSRIELGQEKIRPEHIDLTELIRGTAELVQPLLRRKGLAFSVHMPEEPIRADTDPGKVRQILLNLLSNAVKFTGEGEVALTAEEKGEEVLLEVRDTGAGIPAEELEHIFEPFRQAEHAQERRENSTGLGLSVSKKLAEMLGGTVSVESTVGEGSTFRVRLPGSRRNPGGAGGGVWT